MTQTTDSPAALIADGASLSRLRRCFATKAEALRFYADYYANRYADAGSTCSLCDSPAAVPVVFTWRALYNARFSPQAVDVLLLLLGFVRISTSATSLTFDTQHAFCAACWRRLAFKRAAGNVLHFLSLLLGVISLVMACSLGAMYLYFRTDPTWRDDVNQILLTAVACAVVCIGCVALFFYAYRLRVPPSLRAIPRFPFRYARARRAKGAS